MSNPNPLVPQGTFADKGKSHVRLAFFTIAAIHVVLLSALLIAGCKRTATEDQPAPEQTAITPPPPPPIEPPVLPPPMDTNVAPVAPPPVVDIAPPPPQPPVVPVVPETPAQVHVIVKGDTFAVLAKKYGVSVNALKEANPTLNPTRLKIGDKVNIPAATAKPSASPNATAPAASESKTYKVKSGDNLTKIAKANGTTPKALRAANHLATDQIKVGQVLKIPSKAAPAAPATAPVPVPAPEPIPAPAPAPEPAPAPAPLTPVPMTPPAGAPSNT